MKIALEDTLTGGLVLSRGALCDRRRARMVSCWLTRSLKLARLVWPWRRAG